MQKGTELFSSEYLSCYFQIVQTDTLGSTALKCVKHHRMVWSVHWNASVFRVTTCTVAIWPPVQEVQHRFNIHNNIVQQFYLFHWSFVFFCFYTLTKTGTCFNVSISEQINCKSQVLRIIITHILTLLVHIKMLFIIHYKSPTGFTGGGVLCFFVCSSIRLSRWLSVPL